MIFFLTLTIRVPFQRKDFEWKKLVSTRLISEKTKGLYAKLNERVEAATGSYSVIGDSLQYIYSVPVTKIHRNIQSRCLVHELFFTDILDDINHDYRVAILKEKFFVGYLFLLWKSAQNDAQYNCIKPA